VRWHYRDAGLLWLFVPAYGVHLVEEWLGGFPAWIATVVGRPLPGTAFLIINAVAMVLVVIGIRAAVSAERYGWIGVAIATVFLINTVSHLAGSLVTGTYSPGLLSAVILYVPLALLTLTRAVDQAPRDHVLRGAIVGAVIHFIVFIVAFAATSA
jgi:uncharacterized protein with HXXEE motif